MPNPKTSSIGNFGTLAPQYWEAGYTVIPVEHGTRKASTGYDGLVNQLPQPKTRERLLKQSDNGIGLLMGQKFGDDTMTVAVDVDDDRVVRFVREIVGSAPAKFGSKGGTFFMRMPQSCKIKQIKNSKVNGNALVEFLASGQMTILPPTIHWQTEAPYRWISDQTLPEVAPADLPELPMWKVRLIERVLQWDRLSEILDGVGTHDPMRDLVFYSMGWFGDDSDEPDMELLRQALAALLPVDYDGNTIKELNSDRGNAMGKGALDADRAGTKRYPRPGNDGKETVASKLFAQIEESASEFFHDKSGGTFVAVRCDGGGSEAFSTDSQSMRTWLLRMARRAGMMTLSEKAQKEIAGALHARALFDGEERETYVRTGRGKNDDIVLDLGIRGDGRAVVISPNAEHGFEVTTDHGVQFWRPDGILPLPIPAPGGKLDELRDLLNSHKDDDWARLLAFILASLNPEPPYIGLAVSGPEGSGKSTLCEMVKMTVDPTRVERSLMPTKIDDMAILVGRKLVTVLDNVSGMRREMSDALCMVLTGGGLEVRTLYTNRELSVIMLGRPLILNGISEFVSQSDLMSRLVPIEAEEPEQRRTEKELRAEFQRIHPMVLGALCRIAAGGLRDLDQTATDPDNRNADVMHWLAACEPHAGLEPGIFVRAITEAQQEANSERVENDPTYNELRRVLKEAAFLGTTAQLFDVMVSDATRPEGMGSMTRTKGFPPNAISLGKWLARNKRVLKQLGVYFERRRARRGFLVTVWHDGQKPDEAKELPHHQEANAERASGGKY